MKFIRYLIVIVIISVLSMPIKAEALTTTVRVGFSLNFPPYQFLDENNNPSGMHIELLESIAEENDLNLVYLPYENTSDCMEAFGKKDLDIVLGVTEGKYSKYKAFSTQALSVSSLCLIAENSVAEDYKINKELKSFRVAIEHNTIDYTYLSKMNCSDIVLKDNNKNAFKAQLEGYADMVVGDKSSLIWFLEENDKKDDYTIINNYISPITYVILVQSEDPYLLSILNRGLATLHTNGQCGIIYNRWISEEGNNFKLILKTVSAIFILVLIIGGAYFAANVKIKKILRTKVAEQVAELSFANNELKLRISQAEKESCLRSKIFEASPGGLVLFEQKGQVVHMNPSAYYLADIPFDKDSDISAFKLPIFGEILKKQEIDLFNDECNHDPINITLDSPNGDKRYYRYSLHQIYEANNISSVLLAIEDMTAEERHKQAVFEREKNEALNKMIASIAHEIKNPLTTISASAAIIKSKGNSEKFVDAFTKYIPIEVERINRLIKNLINYASPQESKIETIDVEEVINSIYYLVLPIINIDKIKIKTLLEKDLFIIIDEDKFRQILLNIMLNSIESIEKKQIKVANEVFYININTWNENEIVKISIEDQGNGMTEEEISLCTKPFYTTKSTGTGIGLVTTKQYIEEAGGKLMIESEKGKYTLLTIYFPSANKDMMQNTEEFK